MDAMERELIKLMGVDVMLSPENRKALGNTASRSFEQTLPERFYDPNHVQIRTGSNNQFLEDRPTMYWTEHPDAGSKEEQRQGPLPGEYDSYPVIAAIIEALANRR